MTQPLSPTPPPPLQTLPGNTRRRCCISSEVLPRSTRPDIPNLPGVGAPPAAPPPSASAAWGTARGPALCVSPTLGLEAGCRVRCLRLAPAPALS